MTKKRLSERNYSNPKRNEDRLVKNVTSEVNAEKLGFRTNNGSLQIMYL